MADNAMLRACGEVLRVQNRSGKSDDGRAWESRTARLLLDDAEVLDVRIPREHDAPAVGTEVDWMVSVTVFESRRGPQLSVALARPVAAAAAA